MTVGIDIAVNAEKVKAAKRDLGVLNSELGKTKDIGGKLDLGSGNIEHVSDLVRRLGEDVRRLKSIAGSGDKQGGLLRPQQFEQAEKSSKRIKENFSAISAEIGKARESLNKLVSERDRLNKIGTSGKYESPADYMRRMGRVEELEGQIAAKEKYLAGVDRLRVRAGRYSRDAGAAGDAIGGYGAIGAPGLGSMLGKRMMAGGLALLGGISAVSLLKDAYSQGETFQPAAADLTMRGGVDLRKNAGILGFLPMEHLQLLDALNRGTGLGGEALNAAGLAAKRFSRGFGLSTDITSGYLGATIQATGGQSVEKQLNRIASAIEKGGIGGRSEEFLRLNASLLSKLAQGTGGRALTGAQTDFVTGLQTFLWNREGMAGKGESGASFMSNLDEGLRQGGRSPGEQLFFFKAAERAMGRPIRSASDYEKFLSMKDQGIQNRDYLRSALELARDQFGGNGKGGLSTIGRLSIRRLFGLRSAQVDMADAMLEQGIFNDANYQKFLGGGDITQRAGLAMSIKGNEKRDVDARAKDKVLGVGEGLVDAVTGTKGAILDFADGIGEATRRAREFLRPEPTPEQRRQMSVLGISGGMDPYKKNSEDEVAKKLQDVYDAIKDMDRGVKQVEVINLPKPQEQNIPAPPAGSGQ